MPLQAHSGLRPAVRLQTSNNMTMHKPSHGKNLLRHESMIACRDQETSQMIALSSISDRLQEGSARDGPTESSDDSAPPVLRCRPPCGILRLPLPCVLPEGMHGCGNQLLAVAGFNQFARRCTVPVTNPRPECLLAQPAHAHALSSSSDADNHVC